MAGLLERNECPLAFERRLYAGVLLIPVLLGLMAVPALGARIQSEIMLIDDFTSATLTSKLGTRWRGVSDKVMGGVSEAAIARESVDGRSSLRLTGDVRLENDGGFVQAALDLDSAGGTLDASGYIGVRLVIRGNGEQYSLHLRTPDNLRPWQSYRAHFAAGPAWETIDLPFDSFVPYRTDAPLDIRRLRRIGLVAIGRAFRADLLVSSIGFYR